jgi:PKD repeat protein
MVYLSYTISKPKTNTMKSRTLFLCTGLFLFFLSACEKNEPKASFTVNSTETEAFDTVYFKNTSENGTKYEWTFGDGSTGSTKNPFHIYQNTGSVEVSLKVWNDDDAVSSARKTLTITDPTLLGLILVMDTIDQVVADCPVLLFLSEDDLWNVENPVDGGASDQDGFLVFKTKPVTYYIFALKEVTGGFLTNLFLGYTTEVLTQHEVNNYTLGMEFVPNKKAGKIRETYNKLLSKTQANK